MTELGQRMRALAATGHERAAELIEKAEAFDAACAGFYGEPQTCDVRKFLGCFARARRLWCDVTGEALV